MGRQERIPIRAMNDATDAACARGLFCFHRDIAQAPACLREPNRPLPRADGIIRPARVSSNL